MKPAALNPKAWRKPLALGLAGAALAWAGISAALHLIETQALPSGELTTLAGKPTNLAALSAGKPTVVNLWATWCPPCRRELPALAIAQQQETDMNFVFVDQGEDALTVERYLGTVRLALANVMLDPGSNLGREIGSTALPVTLFYDASGRMVDSHLGALSPASLAGKLGRLRAPASRAAKE
jgi:thiol-disulfide isomerase/thioredoxin